MKKGARIFSFLLIISLLSISIVSAAWYSPITDFFKKIFIVGEKDEKQTGELGTSGLYSSSYSCSDTDNGKNYLTYASCIDSSKTNFDNCSSGVLREWFCDYYDSSPSSFSYCNSEYISCSQKYGPDYVCEEGKCVKKVTETIVCSDRDIKNFYNKGNCIDQYNKTNEDYCTGDILNEYLCSSNFCKTITYDCSSEGKICNNGACVDSASTCIVEENSFCNGTNSCRLYKNTCINGSQTCIDYANAAYGTLCGNHGACNGFGNCYEYNFCNDSDKTSVYTNAKNIYEKGFMNMRSYPLGGTPNNYTTGVWESCSSTTKVKEYYCASNGAAIWEYVTCPKGYTCLDGACKSSQTNCTQGWFCNGNYSQYKNASCAMTRSNYCINGCNQTSKLCNPAITCTQGWFCNGNYSQYKNANCSINSSIYCENGCENGSCVNMPNSDPYLIEEDIDVLTYNQTIVNNNCQVLKNMNCENHKAIYYAQSPGIDSVEAIVEIPQKNLTNQELENYIINAYVSWAENYELETWKEKENVYVFYKKDNSYILDYIIAWYSNNKVVLNKLNSWNGSELEGYFLDSFIQEYLVKHPSEIITEDNKCYLLENSIRIKIDDLEANGEKVILKEEGDVFENEFFVTSTSYGGQIWKVNKINPILKEVELIEENHQNESLIIPLNNNLEGVFNLNSGEQAKIRVYNNETQSSFIKVSWPPDKIIYTFDNCEYDRESVYIILPNGYSQEEWNFASHLDNWIYENYKLYRGQPIEAQNMFQEDYNNYVSVGIKNNKARIVIPENGNAQDFLFAKDFDQYLKELVTLGQLESVCPILNSSDLTNQDIMQSFCVDEQKEGSCESCGFFGLFCGQQECLNLSEGCYFIDIPFGANECNSCLGFTCSDFLEESDCYSKTCNLECEWNENQCAEKQPLNVGFSFSTQKDVYAINEIIKLSEGGV